MKVWNVTNVKTDQLVMMGLLNVQVQVGTVTLKPGEGPIDVPLEIRAEVALHVRQGLLSETDPNPPKPKAEPEKSSKDEPKAEAPPELEAPAAAPTEASAPSAEEGSSRRRPGR